MKKKRGTSSFSSCCSVWPSARAARARICSRRVHCAACAAVGATVSACSPRFWSSITCVTILTCYTLGARYSRGSFCSFSACRSLCSALADTRSGACSSCAACSPCATRTARAPALAYAWGSSSSAAWTCG